MKFQSRRMAGNTNHLSNTSYVEQHVASSQGLRLSAATLVFVGTQYRHICHFNKHQSCRRAGQSLQDGGGTAWGAKRPGSNAGGR